MKVVFTLDYELFLGSKTGSVERCFIEPLERMVEMTEKFDIKFTLFVDATYLLRLTEYAEKFPVLKTSLELIADHLRRLHEEGHDIQLHIHPHWAYSTYDGTQWYLDEQHYKLSDLTEREASLIFARAKETLENIVGKSVCAFRAGGFSTQPTERLVKLFDENNIFIDSSVYPGNCYKSSHQDYDYRECPKKSIYRFNSNICNEDINGRILEIPLTTYPLLPTFYWGMVFRKLLNRAKHRMIGDGIAVKTTNESIKERLTQRSIGFATIDGYKIRYLYDAYLLARKREQEVFCVLGHPKLATPYSLNNLRRFCDKVKHEVEFVTISSFF